MYVAGKSEGGCISYEGVNGAQKSGKGSMPLEGAEVDVL